MSASKDSSYDVRDRGTQTGEQPFDSLMSEDSSSDQKDTTVNEEEPNTEEASAALPTAITTTTTTTTSNSKASRNDSRNQVASKKTATKPINEFICELQHDKDPPLSKPEMEQAVYDKFYGPNADGDRKEKTKHAGPSPDGETLNDRWIRSRIMHEILKERSIRPDWLKPEHVLPDATLPPAHDPQFEDAKKIMDHLTKDESVPWRLVRDCKDWLKACDDEAKQSRGGRNQSIPGISRAPRPRKTTKQKGKGEEKPGYQAWGTSGVDYEGDCEDDEEAPPTGAEFGEAFKEFIQGEEVDMEIQSDEPRSNEGEESKVEKLKDENDAVKEEKKLKV